MSDEKMDRLRDKLALTETEAIASFNRHDLDNIARLEAEIASLRKNLLVRT